jgi:hypothetical protein
VCSVVDIVVVDVVPAQSALQQKLQHEVEHTVAEATRRLADEQSSAQRTTAALQEEVSSWKARVDELQVWVARCSASAVCMDGL